MYYILLNDDDFLYPSKKERIMQRSKLVDTLIFLVNPIYRNTHDMSNASVLLEYVLPVSRKYDTINLVLDNETYEGYLQYKLPFDTNITSERGSVEMQLTFAWTELTPNGEGVQRVRKTSVTSIEITPITAWSDIVPDASLSALDQRIIKLDATTRALNDYIDILETNKVDDLKYNDTNDTLYLTAKGAKVGHGVSVKDVLDDGVPVVDLNSGSGSGDSSGSCNCGDCNCEDNVVEFGYASGSTTPEVPKEDEDNVIEF